MNITMAPIKENITLTSEIEIKLTRLNQSILDFYLKRNGSETSFSQETTKKLNLHEENLHENGPNKYFKEGEGVVSSSAPKTSGSVTIPHKSADKIKLTTTLVSRVSADNVSLPNPNESKPESTTHNCSVETLNEAKIVESDLRTVVKKKKKRKQKDSEDTFEKSDSIPLSQIQTKKKANPKKKERKLKGIEQNIQKLKNAGVSKTKNINFQKNKMLVKKRLLSLRNCNVRNSNLRQKTVVKKPQSNILISELADETAGTSSSGEEGGSIFRGFDRDHANELLMIYRENLKEPCEYTRCVKQIKACVGCQRYDGNGCNSIASEDTIPLGNNIETQQEDLMDSVISQQEDPMNSLVSSQEDPLNNSVSQQEDPMNSLRSQQSIDEQSQGINSVDSNLMEVSDEEESGREPEETLNDYVNSETSEASGVNQNNRNCQHKNTGPRDSNFEESLIENCSNCVYLYTELALTQYLNHFNSDNSGSVLVNYLMQKTFNVLSKGNYNTQMNELTECVLLGLRDRVRSADRLTEADVKATNIKNMEVRAAVLDHQNSGLCKFKFVLSHFFYLFHRSWAEGFHILESRVASMCNPNEKYVLVDILELFMNFTLMLRQERNIEMEECPGEFVKSVFENHFSVIFIALLNTISPCGKKNIVTSDINFESLSFFWNIYCSYEENTKNNVNAKRRNFPILCLSAENAFPNNLNIRINFPNVQNNKVNEEVSASQNDGANLLQNSSSQKRINKCTVPNPTTSQPQQQPNGSFARTSNFSSESVSSPSTSTQNNVEDHSRTSCSDLSFSYQKEEDVEENRLHKYIIRSTLLGNMMAERESQSLLRFNRSPASCNHNKAKWQASVQRKQVVNNPRRKLKRSFSEENVNRNSHFLQDEPPINRNSFNFFNFDNTSCWSLKTSDSESDPEFKSEEPAIPADEISPKLSAKEKSSLQLSAPRPSTSTPVSDVEHQNCNSDVNNCSKEKSPSPQLKNSNIKPSENIVWRKSRFFNRNQPEPSSAFATDIQKNQEACVQNLEQHNLDLSPENDTFVGSHPIKEESDDSSLSDSEEEDDTNEAFCDSTFIKKVEREESPETEVSSFI